MELFSISEMKKLVAELSANSNLFSGKFHGVACDITKEKDIENTFQKIDASIGPVWILVNNAGTATDSRLSGNIIYISTG